MMQPTNSLFIVKYRNRVRCALIFAMVALCLVSPGMLPAQEAPDRGPIVIGTELDYPPFSRTNIDGDPVGFNISLSTAIAEIAGIEAEIRIDTWPNTLRALETGEIDVIAGMYYSPERDRRFDFSPPFAVVDHVAYSRPGKPPVQSVADLYRSEILVMRGDIMHDFLLSSPITDRIVVVETQSEALRLVAMGAGDYALVARYPGMYWIDELGLTDLVEHPLKIETAEYCFAVREGEEKLLSLLSEGLETLQADGRFDEIYRERIGYLESPSFFESRLFRVLATVTVVTIALLLVGLVWIWSLRRLVALRTRELQVAVERYGVSEHRLEHSVGVLETVRQVGRLITHERDRARLLHEICRLLTDSRDYYYAWIALDTGDRYECFHAGSGVDFGGLTAMLADGELPPCASAALDSDQTVVLADPAPECRGCPLSGRIEGAGALARALRISGKTFGTLTVALPREFVDRPLEATIFSELADDIVLALESIDLENEKNRMTRRLAEANRIVENSPIVLFRWGVESNLPVHYVSDNVSNLGIDPGAFLEQEIPYASFIHPDDLDDVSREVSATTAEGERDLACVYRIIDSSGQIKWVEQRTSAVRDATGRIVEYEGVVIDMTAQRRSEASINSRLRYERAIANSSKLLLQEVHGDRSATFEAVIQELLDATGTGRVYLFENELDAQGSLCMTQRYEACSPGVKPEIDNPELTLLPYKAGYTRWLAQFEKGLAVSGPVSSFPRSEREVLEAQSIRSLLAVPIINSAGLFGFIGFDDVIHERSWEDEDIRVIRTVAQMMGSYLDRAERERTRRALERRVVVAQKQQSLGEMAGAIAHHYNNLFTALLGNLSFARGADDRQALDTYLERIEHEVERGVTLSRQMLTYVGQGTEMKRPCNLSALIEPIASAVRTRVPPAVRVETRIARDLPQITGDPEAISRAAESLVTNAIEALHPSGGVIEIGTSLVWLDEPKTDDTPDERTVGPGHYVALEVSDDGVGLTEDQRARMFDPFYSTKFVGRGLGLAAVFGILRAHDAAVFVETQPDRGTTVRVLFPQRESEGTDR